MTGFEVIEAPVCVDDFMRLRAVAGLSPRDAKGAAIGLPNSLYGVHFRHEGTAVAMGRVVGDGGLNFEIVDVAVDPAYQGRGLGKAVMRHIMRYLSRAAPDRAYITLIGDEPAFYRKLGFRSVRPESDGMYMLAPVRVDF
jgi:ribosomal protein S18 acetylase RimI-like enzyme